MRESQEIEKAVIAAEENAGTGADFDPRLFRDALGRFATGVTLITTCEEGGDTPVGITVNSFASVSLDPALVLWSAARSSLRHRHFSAATAFAIHVLRDGQQDLVQRFARSGPGFDGLAFHRGHDGVPLIDGVIARFECTTEARHEGGDHTIIIGKVERFMMDDTAKPLLFWGGRFGHLQA